MKRKSKNKVPSFIPNQPGSGFFGLDQGKRGQDEARKNRDNQKKLMLNNKNKTY